MTQKSYSGVRVYNSLPLAVALLSRFQPVMKITLYRRGHSLFDKNVSEFKKCFDSAGIKNGKITVFSIFYVRIGKITELRVPVPALYSEKKKC